MKRFTTLLLLTIGIGLWFTACKPLYTSNPVNIPLLSQDGEAQIALSAGSNGYNAEFAWAPLEHVAVMGNGGTYSVSFDSSFTSKFSRSFGEFGFGYWTRLEKYIRFETFAGAGWGITGELPQRDLYRRFFIQPNIGYSGPFVDTGFSPRFSFVQHTETRNSSGTTKLTDGGVFFEPTLMFRAGWENLKFQVRASGHLPMSNTDFNRRNLTLSFGFHLILGKDFEKYSYSYD